MRSAMNVVATIGVHGEPYFIDVSADGKRLMWRIQIGQCLRD